jgi:tyrosyl-tRNA synthetase
VSAARSKLPPDLDTILRRGVIEIIPHQEFVDALGSGRKLRLKLGLDPSKPDLHIGHAVLLRKLRRLQELGHQVVLIVGDWTAQIGDPSGQSITRPMLAAEEVKANAETYMRQFFHVVDREKTDVRWQSEWFGAFTLEDVVRLAGRFTVAQMLQREDFRTRFEAHKPLGIHELLYPLLQAHDSVVIEADVEFGGSDQRFNLLVGRELQEAVGQRPQAVFIMNLLVGTDGAQKMSKSLGNTVDLEDPPHEQYGKVMSIPDSALLDYLELATDLPDEELGFIRKQLDERAVNPMLVKKRLAKEVVTMFHGQPSAEAAEAEYERVFQRHEAPEEATTIAVQRAADGSLVVNLPDVLAEHGIAPSKAEARRLIRQGAVEVGGAKVPLDSAHALIVESGAIMRVGKHRFLRIVDAGAKPP